MATITHIKASQRDARRLHIRVGNKAAATLPASIVAELGLTVGQIWDEAVAGQVAEAVEYDQALRRAARQVDRRVRSGAQMEEKLRGWGYGAGLVQRVMRRLGELGLIDDLALGRALAEEVLRRGPAGSALLRAKLESRGLRPGVVDQVIEEVSGAKGKEVTEVEGRSEIEGEAMGVAGAAALARQRLAKMGGLDATTRRRRLWGFLARRGFDEETIEAALRGIVEVGEE